MERLEAIVSGKVQGVMYRDFVAREALFLGLAGEVCNMPDGTVSIVAEGSRMDLEIFIAKLRTGSFWSRVKGVAAVWKPASNSYTAFTIARW